MTSGVPSSSRNCLGVSAPMRVPSPAAGRMAAMRLMFWIARDTAPAGWRNAACANFRVYRNARYDANYATPRTPVCFVRLKAAYELLSLDSRGQKHESGNLPEIHARNALADGAEQIGRHGTDAARDDVCGMNVFPVRAVDGDHVSDSGFGNIRDVNHGDVHRDDADDRSEPAAYQHAAFIAERAMNPVAVARGENRDARRARGDEFFVVAHSGAGGDIANADDASAQTHHHFERQARFDFRPLLDGVVARMVAVQYRARPDHIGPGFGACGNRGAVGEVYDAWVDAERTKAIQRGIKTLFLLVRLFSGARVSQDFGGCKVREHAAEFQMLALRELARETLDVARRDAEAIHAAIHFQVERKFFSALFAGAASGGAIQLLELFAADDDGGQVVFEEPRLFAGPETREHENRFADSSFADGNAFLRAGDAEPIGTGFFESFSDLRPSVAVAVALDDAQDFARRFPLLARRIHKRADGPKILGERRKGNFRPDRAAVHFMGTLLGSCHGDTGKH